MNLINNGWFSEMSDFVPGQSMSLKVKDVLCHKQTKYQDLLIFDSTNHGRVLVLDGMIQLTEKDEFMYQEMIAMLPLACHSNPKNVLIVGGGDGGVAREVLKDKRVEKIVICELDEDVIEMSKKYLPFTAESFNSKKVEVLVKDGMQYMTEHVNEYDVIITDSTDPVGPAESLFEDNYYLKIFNALKPDGVMCSQGEGMWLENDIVMKIVKKCKQIFPVVQYAYGCVPTYPTGQIGYLLCGKSASTDFTKPVYDISSFEDQFRYYSTEVHSSAFVLPNIITKMLGE